MIVINTQEANNHPEMVELIKKSGEPYEIKKLDLGDLGVEGLEESVLAERKGAKDFWASVIDGRLWSQTKDLSKARDEGFLPIVIIELTELGSLRFDPRTHKSHYVETEMFKTNEMQFYNAQIGVGKWGVSIVLTSSTEGTARFLAYLSKKLGQPKERKTYPERAGFRKKFTLQQKKVYLWQAFGGETGKALAKYDHQIASVIWGANEGMPKEDALNLIASIPLESGRKIGNAKAEEILSVLPVDKWRES